MKEVFSQPLLEVLISKRLGGLEGSSICVDLQTVGFRYPNARCLLITVVSTDHEGEII